MTDQTVIPPSRPQRSMSIKGLIPRLPERGHVKVGALGEKRMAKSGREYALPMKLDHFRITTLQRGADGNFMVDQEVHKLFGERPTEIPIRLLYDQIDLNFSTRYAVYAGRNLWCSGDGETAIRTSKEPADRPLPEPFSVQCPCYRQAPGYSGADKCKPNGRLSFLIDGVSGIGGAFVFRTTSFNSVTGILSSLAFLRSVTGGILANIPLRLRVQPKQATNPSDQSSVLIYVVGIEFAGDLSELQQFARQIALDRATTQMSIVHVEEEARRILSLPGPDNAILPGDDPEAVREEFYPETQDVAEGEQTTPARPTRADFVAPQAPEPKKDEPSPAPTLNEAEQAEYDALVEAGGTAAAEGTEIFTVFWNSPAAKSYRKELSEHLSDWYAVAKVADETTPFEVIDMVGNVVEYPEVDNAVAAYRAALAEAEKDKGEAGLTTVWDNNQGLMQRLDERGYDALSKELSTEYGLARQAAAAAREEEEVRSRRGPPDGDVSSDEVPRGTGAPTIEQMVERFPPPQAGAEPAMPPEPTGDSNDTTVAAQAPSPAGPGPTATTPASRSETPDDLFGARDPAFWQAKDGRRRLPEDAAGFMRDLPKRLAECRDMAEVLDVERHNAITARKLGPVLVPTIARMIADRQAQFRGEG